MDRIPGGPSREPARFASQPAFNALHRKCQGVVGKLMTQWQRSGIYANKEARHFYLDNLDQLAISPEQGHINQYELSSATIARQGISDRIGAVLEMPEGETLLTPESRQVLRELKQELDDSKPIATVIDGLRAKSRAVRRGLAKGDLSHLAGKAPEGATPEELKALSEQIASEVAQLQPGDSGCLFNGGTFDHETQIYIQRTGEDTYILTEFDSAPGTITQWSGTKEQMCNPELYMHRLAEKLACKPEGEEPELTLLHDQSKSTRKQKSNTCGFQSIMRWMRWRFEGAQGSSEQYKLVHALMGRPPLAEDVDPKVAKLCQTRQLLRNRYIDQAHTASNPDSLEEAKEQFRAVFEELGQLESFDESASLEELTRALYAALKEGKISKSQLQEMLAKSPSPVVRSAMHRYALDLSTSGKAREQLQKLATYNDDSLGKRVAKVLSKASFGKLSSDRIATFFGWRVSPSEVRGLETRAEELRRVEVANLPDEEVFGFCQECVEGSKEPKSDILVFEEGIKRRLLAGNVDEAMSYLAPIAEDREQADLIDDVLNQMILQGKAEQAAQFIDNHPKYAKYLKSGFASIRLLETLALNDENAHQSPLVEAMGKPKRRTFESLFRGLVKRESAEQALLAVRNLGGTQETVLFEWSLFLVDALKGERDLDDLLSGWSELPKCSYTQGVELFSAPGMTFHLRKFAKGADSETYLKLLQALPMSEELISKLIDQATLEMPLIDIQTVVRLIESKAADRPADSEEMLSDMIKNLAKKELETLTLEMIEKHPMATKGLWLPVINQLSKEGAQKAIDLLATQHGAPKRRRIQKAIQEKGLTL